jgi:5-methylcytosine-specific restriction protein A
VTQSDLAHFVVGPRGTALPFEVGALYNRKAQIHALLGGQQQGGISTPRDQPFVIIFTGEAGKSHGYADFWDDEGIFHYFGEGQSGDMKTSGGNLAIDRHQQEGKRLLLFKSMGKGMPYRYDGEFLKVSAYSRPDTPATRGPNRTALVFRLQPLDQSAFLPAAKISEPSTAELELGSTAVLKLTEVRTKQELFKRRLIGIEKQCRLTHVMDLRFLRASHIKPWSACESGTERTDGNNGLLLTPHADLLFDRGWISFEDSGGLLVTTELPSDVHTRIGLHLKAGRSCGAFTEQQQRYLSFHRQQVFEKRYKAATNPINDLVSAIVSD